MIQDDVPYEKVLFVCTNERSPGKTTGCGNRESLALRETLKARIAELSLKGVVRVCKSGCMGKCGMGPNAWLFPDNLWFSDVQEDDLDELLAALVEDVKP
jgi:(2Fe-2S) ferredoxin